MEDDLLAEARRYIDRAGAAISVIHLGPLDYNIAQTRDDLMAADRCLEAYRIKMNTKNA